MKPHNFLLCLLVLSLFSVHPSNARVSSTCDNFEYTFSGVFKPEMFSGKNISFLNNNIDADKIWFMRHTLDLNLDVLYGKLTYCKPVIEFYFTIRNRGIWGNRNIAATTESETKVLDATQAPHFHFIPRQIFWMRECWMSVDLPKMLHLNFENEHSITLGAFSFQLGRGIALGDAYAVGPELLGFYTDFVVDQYAFGAKLSGEIVKKRLLYDLYAAILQNRCSTLSDTTARIRAQEFGRLTNPIRGFGFVNFIVAARLFWNVFQSERYGKFVLEPYVLYNSDPEQKIEFLADSSSKLGTLGFAGEYYGPRFEFGFDYAFNIGQQRVKGWDRNQTILENRNGQVILSNDKVVDQNNNNIPFISGSAAQNIILTSFQSEAENGQIIGVVPSVGFVTGPVTLTNKSTRFRNPSSNQYEGWMFTVDGLAWLYKHDLNIAVAAGIATGDRNPNEETVDRVFSGFLGLQSIYSGKRVRSAFVLGGAGKIRRPLSSPTSEQAPSQFAPVVDGFTNLVFWGMSSIWKPSWTRNEFVFWPNILFYWEEKTRNKFDYLTKKELDQPASTYLGVELNIFMHYYVFTDMKIFLVGSLFLPGQHFKDIAGIPLNSDQARLLDRLDRSGFSRNRIPNLGSDAAYTLNLGLEFKF